ncbi:hypothetical protein B0T25DRAFT_127304 [Lasiosphaeria hispida]|uniref:Uncharacterized protein n=1 Tax=Lasiosphaeria hispida TaxID=260671 RepID=A0AAJ0HS83_9PEZI|nr:hypothetical protein B0T25DRAFT_127304 [Lasiosphaeria hispida]
MLVMVLLLGGVSRTEEAIRSSRLATVGGWLTGWLAACMGRSDNVERGFECGIACCVTVLSAWSAVSSVGCRGYLEVRERQYGRPQHGMSAMGQYSACPKSQADSSRGKLPYRTLAPKLPSPNHHQLVNPSNPSSPRSSRAPHASRLSSGWLSLASPLPPPSVCCCPCARLCRAACGSASVSLRL